MPKNNVTKRPVNVTGLMFLKRRLMLFSCPFGAIRIGSESSATLTSGPAVKRVVSDFFGENVFGV